MSFNSESGFDSRLSAAKTLVQVMNTYGIIPSRAEDSTSELTDFFSTIIANRTNLDIATANYNAAVVGREAAFSSKSNTSIDKMLTLIRKYLESLYGKDSLEVNQIAAKIKDIRSKAPAVKKNSDGTTSTISQNQLSYGSKIGKFASLVTVLATFNGYDPEIPHLKLPALQAFIADVNTLNDTAASNNSAMKRLKEERIMLFKDLRERCLRVKAYIDYKHGKDSNAYKDIKNLKF